MENVRISLYAREILMSMVVLKTDRIPEGETVTLQTLLHLNDLSPATVMVRVDGTVIQKQNFDSLQISRGTVVKASPLRRWRIGAKCEQYTNYQWQRKRLLIDVICGEARAIDWNFQADLALHGGICIVPLADCNGWRGEL